MTAIAAIAAPSMFAVLDEGDSAGWVHVQQKPRKPKHKPAPHQLLTGKPVAQPFDYYAVVDFECTCERGDSWWLHEIIELPVVFVNVRSRRVELGKSRAMHRQRRQQQSLHSPLCAHNTAAFSSALWLAVFHSFVRPTERPKLTGFCTELTGITQATVDSAPTLPTVLNQLYAFLQQHDLTFPSTTPPPPTASAASISCCWLCDGQSDLHHFLHAEVSRKRLSTPASLFSHYCDIRLVFGSYHPHCTRPHLQRMLREVGLRFIGRPHSGLDDAKNVARLLLELIARGALVNSNSRLPAD